MCALRKWNVAGVEMSHVITVGLWIMRYCVCLCIHRDEWNHLFFIYTGH